MVGSQFKISDSLNKTEKEEKRRERMTGIKRYTSLSEVRA